MTLEEILEPLALAFYGQQEDLKQICSFQDFYTLFCRDLTASFPGPGRAMELTGLAGRGSGEPFEPDRLDEPGVVHGGGSYHSGGGQRHCHRTDDPGRPAGITDMGIPRCTAMIWR